MRRTAFLAVAFALVVSLPAGTAQVFGDDPSFRIAEPRAGDRGTYRLVDPLPQDAESEDAVVRFAVEDPQLRSDAYGTERELFPVTFDPAPAAPPQGARQRGWAAWTTWLAGQASGPIATDRPAPPNEGFGFTAGPLGDADREGPRARGELRYAHDAHRLDGPACWLFTPLRGDELTDGRTPTVTPCGRNLTAAAGANATRLTTSQGPIRTLDGGGHTATVHVTATGRNLHAQLSLTYRSEIPVPTRIHLTAEHAPGLADPSALSFVWETLVEPVDALARGPDPGNHTPGHRGEPITATLELVSFARGQGPEIPHGEAISWPEHRPGVQQAPLTRWGPQAGGETFEFSLTEAQAAIQDDPTLAEFHAWLDGHPDARAILATHQRLEGEQRSAWSFWFVAPDRTAWGLRSEQRADPGIELDAQPVDPSLVTNRAQRMDRFPPCPEGCTFSVVPTVDRVPTIRSALTIWQHEAALDAASSTPSAYVWVMSPWFGEMRIAAGWGPAPDQASPLGPLASDPTPEGGNASAILLSPYDGAVTAHQGFSHPSSVTPQPASARLDPARTVTGSPLAPLAAASVAVLTVGAAGLAAIARKP